MGTFKKYATQKRAIFDGLPTYLTIDLLLRNNRTLWPTYFGSVTYLLNDPFQKWLIFEPKTENKITDGIN